MRRRLAQLLPPEQSPVALALSLAFVADITYNPRTNQYRIEWTEPYQSERAPMRNFLLLDVGDFTVDKLLDAFERTVVAFYQRRWDAARERLERVRFGLQTTDAK